MLSRRSFIVGCASGAWLGITADRVQAQAILTEDGYYRQPWFLESFLELADDLASATAKKKRFAVIWELRGCPYCKDMHLINFAKPEISAFIRERFDILQLNIVGAREVTDFDGQKLSEKQFAQKYGVRYTPTIQFFSDKAKDLAKKKPSDREVLRTQGYVEPARFLATFRFVAERAYEKGSLDNYLKAKS